MCGYARLDVGGYAQTRKCIATVNALKGAMLSGKKKLKVVVLSVAVIAPKKVPQ